MQETPIIMSLVPLFRWPDSDKLAHAYVRFFSFQNSVAIVLHYLYFFTQIVAVVAATATAVDSRCFLIL